MTNIKELHRILNQYSKNQVVYDIDGGYVALSFDSLMYSSVGELQIYPMGNNLYKLVFEADEPNTIFTVGMTNCVLNGFQRLVRQEPVTVKLESVTLLERLCHAFDDDTDYESENAHNILKDVSITLSQFGEGNLGAFVNKHQI